MRKLALAVVLILGQAVAVRAQTTPTNYASVDVPFVNAGDPSWATFYFGHLPNGEAGSTALFIQCDFHRAELITNYDVYGVQMTSQFFAVTCSQNGPVFVNGRRTATYTLNATPLSESLVMYGYGGATENLKLTISSATWTVLGYGRGAVSSGGAEIAY